MNTERETIVISRHGIKPDEQTDAIVDESVGSLYRNTGGHVRLFVEENRITPAQAFLRRSNKNRTRQTGKAILAGAFAITPIPQTVQEVEDLYIPGLRDEIDPGLDYNGLSFNEALIEKIGNSDYLEQWLRNPNANEMEGVKVTPFNDVVRRQGLSVVNAINYVEQHGKRLGVLVSHTPLVEPTIVAVINSGRVDLPVESLDEIGGAFSPENFAVLSFDYNPKAGTYGSAQLQRNGQTYAVDLDNLRNLFGGVNE